MPPSTDAWTRRSAVAIAGGLTVVAALVRALARTGRPMWFDEAVTVALARIPGERLAGSADLIQANGGLYVLLARTGRAAAERRRSGRRAARGVLLLRGAVTAARGAAGDPSAASPARAPAALGADPVRC